MVLVAVLVSCLHASKERRLNRLATYRKVGFETVFDQTKRALPDEDDAGKPILLRNLMQVENFFQIFSMATRFLARQLAT